MKVTDYTVVVEVTVELLTQNVMWHLEQGWELYGPLNVQRPDSSQYNWYYQAMVKKKSAKPARKSQSEEI